MAAIAVADGELVLDPLLPLERRPGERDQLVVEHLVEAVVLPLAIVDGDAVRHLRLVEQLLEVEAARLPVADRPLLVEALRLADHLVEGAVAERGHDLAHLLGDEEEVVDGVLGLALEPGAQHRVLRGHADRAGVEVALAHHDAAERDQRRGGEAELVGAQQRADHHVAARAHAAVDLHGDAAAQPVGRPASDASRRDRSPRASRRA